MSNPFRISWRYDPTVDGGYAWFRVIISLLFGTVGTVGLWSYVVVLPEIGRDFEIGRGDASFPYTLTMLGFAFGNFTFGRLADRYGITRPALMAAIGMAVGYIGAAQASSLIFILLFHGLLIGFSTGICFGPLVADISKWFQKRRGLAIAVVASGNYLAGTVWPPVIQYFVEAEGWRTAYVGIGATCFIALIPLALLLRAAPTRVAGVRGETEHREPVSSGEVLQTDLSPRALQYLHVTAGLACCIAMSMPQVHIVAYCVDLGFDAARGAEMLSVMLAAGVVCRISSGWLADKIGGVRTVLLGSVLQCAALFLYLPFNGLASLYVVSLIFGLAQGGIVPSYAVIVREYLPVEVAGRVIGMVIMATVLGMAVGGWLAGAVYEITGSYTAAFLNGIGWNLVNLMVMALILLRSGKTRAVPA